jgi:hypothetical protein
MGCAAQPAAAQAFEVRIRFDSATPKSGLVVSYSVQLSDARTGHPVTDAKPTVTYVRKNGSEAAPTPMRSAGDGYFRADLTFPSSGEWSVRVTAGTATLKVPQTVKGTAKATARPRSAGHEAARDDDGTSEWVVVGVGLAVVAVIAAASYAVRRRRRDAAVPTP